MPRPDTKVYLSVKHYSRRACRCSSDKEGKGRAQPVDHEFAKILDTTVSSGCLRLGGFIVRPPPHPHQPPGNAGPSDHQHDGVTRPVERLSS